MRSASPPLLLLAGALALAFATPAAAQMLPVRDQNPLTRAAYLPLPAALEPAADGRYAFAAGVQWSNTVNVEQTPAERLDVDEETVETDLSVTRGLGDWQLRATLPVIHRGAGVLDSFIDGWHRFFGLPQGERPYVPKNAYTILYQRAAGAPVVAPPGSALGDLALEAGRTLARNSDGHLEGWVGLEAPTGSRRYLTGNGALDGAAWLAGETRLGARWSLGGRVGASYVGGDAGLALERAIGFATAAVGFAATPELAAVLQLDAHSAIARGSDLKFLGNAVELTIGGRYRFASTCSSSTLVREPTAT